MKYSFNFFSYLYTRGNEKWRKQNGEKAYYNKATEEQRKSREQRRDKRGDDEMRKVELKN